MELTRVEKSSWRADKDAKKHDEKFITSGLWGYSRHPKYVSSPPLR
jgi:steroid 5-alpha reductase family enzyme